MSGGAPHGRDIVGTILDLFARFGDRDYGEDVTQRDHALQVAQCAVEDGAPDTLIAAALLHDIGQFLDGAGDAAAREGRDARHEAAGAAFLRPYLPPAVVEPIRLHVEAKRFLCSVEPAYRATLSEASVLSLRLQGGPLDAAEADAFRRTAHADDAIRLRRYDDAGKRTDWTVAPFGSYEALLRRLSPPNAI